MSKASIKQKINLIPLLKCWYLGSFSSDYVPILPNETFAIINTQPTNMQGKHWILIANSCHKTYFVDSLGRQVYSFFKQQDEQIMPEPLPCDPRVCHFYTIYAAFHLLKFRHEEITGVHDVTVPSFKELTSKLLISSFSMCSLYNVF